VVAVAVAAGGEVGLDARHDAQRAAGERLGAAGPPDGLYDVVFEAAGTQSAVDRAIALVRPAGRVIFLSTLWDPVTIPGIEAMMKEATLTWAYTYARHGGGRDLDTAAALLARRPEIADTLITHRMPLADAPDAFRVAADRAHGSIKVVLEPA
jgi:threonine dehydrogenase-like Zn-dependent dehydrogenase